MDVAATSSSQASFTTTSATLHGSQSSTASAFSLAIPSSSFSSLSQDTTTTSSALGDPNSPELFKQNIQLAMEQVTRVNALTRSALNGIQNAYQVGVNPAQTRADLMAFEQAMHTLADLLRRSGVGAYPLSPPDHDSRNMSPPTEQELIADTTRGVQQLYEEFKRMRESSAVVANLLTTLLPESLGRPKA